MDYERLLVRDTSHCLVFSVTLSRKGTVFISGDLLEARAFHWRYKKKQDTVCVCVCVCVPALSNMRLPLCSLVCMKVCEGVCMMDELSDGFQT